MYNFALERGWHQNSFNVPKWIDEYVFTRYGIKNDNILSAWQKLHVSSRVFYSLIEQLYVSFEIKNQKDTNVNNYCTSFIIDLIISILSRKQFTHTTESFQYMENM